MDSRDKERRIKIKQGGITALEKRLSLCKKSVSFTVKYLKGQKTREILNDSPVIYFTNFFHFGIK